MSSNTLDDLAKQLAAAAERQRLEAEVKAAGSAPAPDPAEVSAALEKLTRILAETKPTPVAAPQPGSGTESATKNKTSH